MRPHQWEKMVDLGAGDVLIACALCKRRVVTDAPEKFIALNDCPGKPPFEPKKKFKRRPCRHCGKENP